MQADQPIEGLPQPQTGDDDRVIRKLRKLCPNGFVIFYFDDKDNLEVLESYPSKKDALALHPAIVKWGVVRDAMLTQNLVSNVSDVSKYDDFGMQNIINN